MSITTLSFNKIYSLFTDKGFNSHNRSKNAFQTKGLRVGSTIYYMEEYIDDSTAEGTVYAVSLYKSTDTGTILLCLLNNPAWYRMFSAEMVSNVEYHQEFTEEFSRRIEELLPQHDENFNLHY